MVPCLLIFQVGIHLSTLEKRNYGYKIAMRDFVYYLPIPTVGLSVVVSLVVRPIIKLVADFSASMALRLPDEHGGT